MNYKSFNLGDWIGHISGVIEDETTLDGNEMRDLVEFLSALKQEPKTVLYSGDGYADGYMVYDMAECPNCGYKYEEGDEDWKEPFCPHCGQALKWESEAEE